MSHIHTAACLFLFVSASCGFGDDAQFSERRLLLASNCVHSSESSYIPLRTELSNYTAECTNADNLAESRLLLATILTESSKTNDLYQAIDLCVAITQQATQEWQRALGHFVLSHAYGCAKNYEQQIIIASNAVHLFSTNVMVQSNNPLLTYLRSSGQNYSYHDGLRCMIVQGLCGKRQFDNARTSAALIENANLRVLIEQSIEFYDK